VAIALSIYLCVSLIMGLLPYIMMQSLGVSYETAIFASRIAEFMFNLFEALGYGMVFLALIQAFRQLRAR